VPNTGGLSLEVYRFGYLALVVPTGFKSTHSLRLMLAVWLALGLNRVVGHAVGPANRVDKGILQTGTIVTKEGI